MARSGSAEAERRRPVGNGPDVSGDSSPDAEDLLDQTLSIIGIELGQLEDRASEGLAPEDASKLCNYGRLLATVSKDRKEDDPDDLTPAELEEKASKLLEGMRKARR